MASNGVTANNLDIELEWVNEPRHFVDKMRYLNERLSSHLRNNPQMSLSEKLAFTKQSYDGTLVGRNENVTDHVKLRVNSSIKYEEPLELFISCVDVTNKKVIHPYIVTGTSTSGDGKNDSNGELFKIQIEENQDVDLKIAIMAIVEKEHREVLKLIHDSHVKNGIVQSDESFHTNGNPDGFKFDKNVVHLRCLVKLPNGRIIGPLYSNCIQNWQLKILDISDHYGPVDGGKKQDGKKLILVCSPWKCKKEDLEVHFVYKSMGELQKPLIIGHNDMAIYHNSVIVIDETPKLPQEHRPIPDLNIRHATIRLYNKANQTYSEINGKDCNHDYYFTFKHFAPTQKEMETAKEEMSGRLALETILNGVEVVDLSLGGGENVQGPNVWLTALDNPMLFIVPQEQSAHIANDEVDPPVNVDEAMRSA